MMGKLKTAAGLRDLAGRAAPVSFAALIAISAGVAPAAEPSYCVRPTAVVPAPESAELEPKLVPPLRAPIQPYLIRSSRGVKYPLLIRTYPVKSLDGRDAVHELFWSFSADYQLVGPRSYGFVVWETNGSMAVDHAGRSLWLGSAEDRPAGAFPFYSLLQENEEGALVPVAAELEAQIGEPGLVAWSEVLGGFVIGSTKWRTTPSAGARTGDERVFLLKDDAPVRLQDVAVHLRVVADLPRLGMIALLGSNELVLVTTRLESTKVANLSPGDDYGGFEAAYETRDDGWLYVVGGQYDNAVHIETVEGKWRATSIVRIAEDDGWINSLFRWVFGPASERNGVTETIRTGPCRKFSTAIKRMFFCDHGSTWNDVHSELRGGKLVPIAGGTANLKSFLGDADSLGLALFLGNDSGLYGYDGERVHHIAHADFDIAMIHDLPKVKRTFIESRKDVFEVRAKGGGFELKKLAAPDIAGGFFGDPIRATPDGSAVVLFAASGILRDRRRCAESAVAEQGTRLDRHIRTHSAHGSERLARHYVHDPCRRPPPVLYPCTVQQLMRPTVRVRVGRIGRKPAAPTGD